MCYIEMPRIWTLPQRQYALDKLFNKSADFSVFHLKRELVKASFCGSSQLRFGTSKAVRYLKMNCIKVDECLHKTVLSIQRNGLGVLFFKPEVVDRQAHTRIDYYQIILIANG